MLAKRGAGQLARQVRVRKAISNQQSAISSQSFSITFLLSS